MDTATDEKKGRRSMKKCQHCGVFPGQYHNKDCPERKLTLLSNAPDKPAVTVIRAGDDDDGPASGIMAGQVPDFFLGPIWNIKNNTGSRGVMFRWFLGLKSSYTSKGYSYEKCDILYRVRAATRNKPADG
jgi:hypothetical protein